MKRSVEKREQRSSEGSPDRSIEAGEARLAWGNPAMWKSRWREESLRRYRERPLAERLRAALSLVLRR